MEFLKKHNYFRFQLYSLRFFGIWPIYEFPVSRFTKFCYFIYSAVIRTVFFYHAMFQAVEFCFLTDNFDAFTECLPYADQHFSGFLKVWTVLKNRDNLRWMVDQTEDEPFQRPYQEKYQEEVNKVRRHARAAELTFAGLVVVTVSMNIIKAAVAREEVIEIIQQEINGTVYEFANRHTIRVLPYHIWYPSFVPRHVSPIYEILFINQILGVCVVAGTIISVDMGFLHFIMHSTFHFQCLKNDLRNVREDSVDEVMKRHNTVGQYLSKKMYLDEITEKEIANVMVSKFQSLVDYHIKILEFTDRLEDSCTLVLFVQLFCTLTCLGAILFQLSATEFGSPQFNGILFYVPPLLFQIFTTCWYGNAMMVESGDVFNAVYESNWEQINYEGGYQLIQPYLSMIMFKSLRPTALTAKKFTPITLSVFVSVIKASYTCYTVLDTTDT